MLGRAYRDGQLICDRVEIIVDRDDRVGLARDERRYIAARFLDGRDPVFGKELAELVRRRGAAARRSAERLAPIELVPDADGHRRVTGRLEPPQLRYGGLREIEFGVREQR